MTEDLAPHLLPSGVDAGGTAAALRLWAESGAMWLTGRRNGPPLGGPAGVAPFMEALAALVSRLTDRLGRPVRLDGPALLGERAAIAGHGRQGEVSCGGASFLLRATDGWIAISLARNDDRAAVPAWLDLEVANTHAEDGVAIVMQEVGRHPTRWLVERAELLGLPCSVLGERASGAVDALNRGPAAPTTALDGITVLDLSSLWAGPLCGQILAAAGAQVIKVESMRRPDGARLGPRVFFDLMHAQKQSVALDLGTRGGQQLLAALIDAADVVIEASRPRALAQMGIDAVTSGARVWVSITGHGRAQPMRVGFGDDAAVAGGLAAYDDGGPVFAADAAADPIAGLLAAAAVLDRLAAGGRWLLDVPLAGAAALAVSFGRAWDDSGNGGTTPAAPGEWVAQVARPRARVPAGTAPVLGAHTDGVLRTFGLAR